MAWLNFIVVFVVVVVVVVFVVAVTPCYHFIFSLHQIWRLVTTFLFFGNFSIDFLFHMYFLVRYCRLLEEGSFRGRTTDYIYMVLLGAGIMTVIFSFVNFKTGNI